MKIFAFLFVLFGVLGCRAGEDTKNNNEQLPPTAAAEYQLVEKLYTTLQATWQPKQPGAGVLEQFSDDPSLVTDITRYTEFGLGIELGDGEPWQEYNNLATDYATYDTSDAREEPVSLLYFWHSADPQLIDEESPIRYAGVWQPPFLTGSAYRPQGHLSTQAFEAHVRTAKALAGKSSRNYDFGIVTGDLTDGSQENEMAWFVTAMSGGVIDPDSGINDDPVAGPGNDFSDPFTATGLGAPWYAVIGNHETLYIGSAILNDTIRNAATADTVFLSAITEAFISVAPFEGLQPGFRDGSTLNGDVVTSGKTPADAKRRILDAPDVLTMLQQAPGEPAGHGYTADQAATGDGDFVAMPVEGKPIKVIAFNTVYRNEMGLGDLLEYSQGFVTMQQLEWLEEQLDAALAAKELVILASHHRTGDMHDDSPVSAGALVILFSDYPNVVLHLTGHGHYSASQLCRTADGVCVNASDLDDLEPLANPVGYWELMAPSTVDFPIQSRIMELVYEGDGYLSMYATNIDHNSPGGSLAHQARQLAAGRRIFQDFNYLKTWETRKASRNMILRIKLQDVLADHLETYDWSDRVESLATLAELEGP